VDVYIWFIKGFGEVSEFQKPGLSPIYTPIMVSIIALVVQYFFCYRIWVVKKSARWWCCFIGLISTTQAIAGIMGGSLALSQESFAERFKETELVYIWLIGSVTADTLLAITMSVFLISLNTGYFHQTNHAAAKIIMLVVGTNAISACTALVGLILFSASKNTGYFTTPTIILGKLYANSLLVSFNNRAYINKSKNSYVVNYETSASHSYSYNSGPASRPSDIPISAEITSSDAFEMKLQHISSSNAQSRSQVSYELRRSEF
jgi:hypothetical protein